MGSDMGSELVLGLIAGLIAGNVTQVAGGSDDTGTLVALLVGVAVALIDALVGWPSLRRR